MFKTKTWIMYNVRKHKDDLTKFAAFIVTGDEVIKRISCLSFFF